MKRFIHLLVMMVCFSLASGLANAENVVFSETEMGEYEWVKYGRSKVFESVGGVMKMDKYGWVSYEREFVVPYIDNVMIEEL